LEKLSFLALGAKNSHPYAEAANPEGSFSQGWGRLTNADGDSLSVIWMSVAPVPVDGLLPSVQPIEIASLVMLGLVPLVRAAFIIVPGVVVLVGSVVIASVVVVLPLFLAPVVLRARRSHHRNRGCKGGSQKK
jgi:hypothetical protein